MSITPEQEAHLYVIDPIVAEYTKVLRRYMKLTYDKALQLMDEYGARPLISTDILRKSNDGARQERLLR